jgi:hypothetical protein
MYFTTSRTLVQIIAAAIAFSPAHAQFSREWLNQYGTFSSDSGRAIIVDSLGQSWITGNTAGSLGGPSAGGVDVFLSRLSPTGSIDFTRQRGSANFEGGTGLAFVGANDIFVASSTNAPTLDGKTSLGGYDIVAMRYDTSGTWKETTRFGGSNNESPHGVAGNSQHLLVSGTSRGDALLSKFDVTGAVVWTRYAATSGNQGGVAAAFDNAGNAYLAGYTSGSFPGFTHAGGFDDLFLARYDADGEQTLLKQFGTSGTESFSDLEVDAAGNIYLTGQTTGSLGNQPNAGNGDAFVMKLDSTGTMVWTRLFGGTAAETGNTLALDQAGNIIVGGKSESNFLDHVNLGLDDAFLAAFDVNGDLLATTFLGSAGSDLIDGLAIGPDGGIHVVGSTGGLLTVAGGEYDVFAAKFHFVPEPSGTLLLLVGLTLLFGRQRIRLTKREIVKSSPPF